MSKTARGLKLSRPGAKLRQTVRKPEFRAGFAAHAAGTDFGEDGSDQILWISLPFIEARWQAGEYNAKRLHHELKARGFEGGYDVVRRWTARRRHGPAVRAPFVRVPSTRRITRWLGAEPKRLLEEERCFVEALCNVAPKLKQASEQVRAFADLLRQADSVKLELWLKEAATTDLRGFASGLRQDEAAVRAAIIEPWSNGPVEGQVNRLKLIKRSMYGRAGFDLLRQRVLHAA